MTKTGKQPRGKRSNQSNEPGLSGLMSALNDAITEISNRLEEGQAGEVHRSHEFQTAQGPMRAEAGVRIKVGGLQVDAPASAVQPVNRDRPTAQKQEKPTTRDINFDIIEDSDTWRLTADLPGVTETELELSDCDTGLRIKTSGARSYGAEVPLPEGRHTDELIVRLHNGILDLTLQPKKTG